VCSEISARIMVEVLVLLRLILRRVRKRAYVIEHVTKVTAIDPPAAVALNEMLSFIRRLSTDALAEIFSAWDARDVVHRG
jgi:hypothetical protein